MLRDRRLEEQRPLKGELASPFDLLCASFAVYSRSFWRLVAIPGVGRLISNVLSATARQESTPWAFLVLLLDLSVPLAFESAVIWRRFGFAAAKRPSQPEC